MSNIWELFLSVCCTDEIILP